MYYFYLNDTQLPIPPKALTINYSNKNETLDLLSVGEVTIPKPMGLTNYSFEILLPNSKYPFNQSILHKHEKAEYYMTRILKAKRDRQPIHFIVVRMKPNGEMISMLNQRVTIEDLVHKEDTDYGFDARLEISLKEWRDYGTKKVVIDNEKDGTLTAHIDNTRPSDKIPEKEVKAGPKATLLRVVKEQFGNTNNLFKIAALNKITVPCYLEGGQALNMYKQGKVDDIWKNLIQ